LVRGWHCPIVGASTLVSEEEGPDNQYEVEGVEGRWRVKSFYTKGRSAVVLVMGGVCIV
jgi:hypothetical protein